MAQLTAVIATEDAEFRSAATDLVRGSGVPIGVDDAAEVDANKPPPSIALVDGRPGEPAPDPIGPFIDAFEARGISYLDLTPYFQEGARKGRQLFFEVDGHPNLEGYRLTAREVAAHLRQNADVYGLPATTDDVY